MSIEVAVRNPERLEGILRTFSKFEGKILDDETILDIYAQLFLDGAVTSDSVSDDMLDLSIMREWVFNNCSHNNEWGFPTGYQGAFTRYLKTLSEFGFIYSQYEETFMISPVAKALLSGKISLSEAFALQCMRFWRKSPYRRVLNDFNYFSFIMDTLIELNKSGKRLSIVQFMVSLFSDDGDVNSFLKLINTYRIGSDLDAAYNLVNLKYHKIDSDHAKVSKIDTAFRDYGNSVFRVLQLTGFITVECNGIILISPNKSRLPFYKALKECDFRISEEAQESELKYFEEIGSFNISIENLIYEFREPIDHSTEGYNTKIPAIIESYKLDVARIEQELKQIDNSRYQSKFWFIQAPVKFEFLLTLYIYSYFGDRFIYKPNYICDDAGIPFSHAPGNMGDIEVYNEELYWLIEATLIRAKTQQINNETVNLFRHINENESKDKYLTLVAPYIHDDTKLIINVATLITMFERDYSLLSSSAQTTEEFVNDVKNEDIFNLMMTQTKEFILEFREFLNNCQIE